MRVDVGEIPACSRFIFLAQGYYENVVITSQNLFFFVRQIRIFMVTLKIS